MQLHLVELVALKPITGDWGIAHPGQRFKTDNRTAESLESRALAERYFEPPKMMQAAPQNKMLPTPENKTAKFPLRRSSNDGRNI